VLNIFNDTSHTSLNIACHQITMTYNAPTNPRLLWETSEWFIN